MKPGQVTLLLIVALAAVAYFFEVPADRCVGSWGSCPRAIAAPVSMRPEAMPPPSSRPGATFEDDQGAKANGLIVGFATGYAAGADREFVASLAAEVRHNCALDTLGVVVEVSETTGNARLGEAIVERIQASDTTVAINASVGVSELLVSPAEVHFRIGAEDRCNRRSDRNFFVLIEDRPPPGPRKRNGHEDSNP